MKECILGILIAIRLNERYINLCNNYNNFDERANLNRKDVEKIIKFYDADFKYIAKDRTFLKEMTFGEYTVRLFIGYKSGITGLGYLIWKEGENLNFYKGNLFTLSKEIDSKFEEKVQYNSPIATSLEDFREILTEIFDLLDLFKQQFNNINW